MMMMIIIIKFVERGINYALSISRTGGCRANVNGERVAVRRAADKLFQVTGPATVKLFIPSMVALHVVLLLRTESSFSLHAIIND